MTRVMLMTFFGDKRWDSSGASEATGDQNVHPHEAPAVMTLPMILLAIGSVVSGGALAIGGTFEHWLEPVVGPHEAHHVVPVWVATAVILSVVAVGIAIAYGMYGTRAVPQEAPAGSTMAVAARKDLYGDAFNEAVFMRGGQVLTKAVIEVDDKGVDGAATGLATLVGRFSNGLRQLQTGFARSYALSMLAGAALLVAAMLVVRSW
jgi:NADH-quinone oxidoreductase subunit L